MVYLNWKGRKYRSTFLWKYLLTIINSSIHSMDTTHFYAKKAIFGSPKCNFRTSKKRSQGKKWPRTQLPTPGFLAGPQKSAKKVIFHWKWPFLDHFGGYPPPGLTPGPPIWPNRGVQRAIRGGVPPKKVQKVPFSRKTPPFSRFWGSPRVLAGGYRQFSAETPFSSGKYDGKPGFWLFGQKTGPPNWGGPGLARPPSDCQIGGGPLAKPGVPPLFQLGDPPKTVIPPKKMGFGGPKMALFEAGGKKVTFGSPRVTKYDGDCVIFSKKSRFPVIFGYSGRFILTRVPR